MNKFYTLAVAAMLACQASAQNPVKWDEVAFSKMSPDGNWLIENLQGSLNVLDRSTGNTYSCSDPDGLAMYMPGLGLCTTNSGTIVGMAENYASVWKNGTWTHLPQATGVETSYNSANAITPDESRIVGILGNDGASMQGQNADMMAYPVVWTKNSKGEYDCTKLPCPDKDFAGLVPQYITVMCVSDDGKTVAGHLRDFTGFYVMPIVFHENDKGEWSYRVIGQKEVYKEDLIGELPEMPTSPTMPDPGQYMTAADVENYNAAIEEYNEKVQLYFDGLIDEYPTYPSYEDYMSNETAKANYKAAVEQYQKDQQKYMEDYTAYITKRNEIVTNKSFVQNVAFLTADGRYLGVALEDRSSAEGWGGTTDKYVGYFDLTQDKPEFVTVTDGGDYTLTGLTNKREMFVATPAMENTRNTFVVDAANANTTLPLTDYISRKNADAAKWVKDNNSYDVNIYELDDDWNYVVVDTKKDSLITGTVTVSPDGNVVLSYYTDNFTDMDSQKKVSYLVNLNAATGLHAVASDESRRHLAVSVNGHTIAATDNKAHMQVYDLSGRLVSSADGSTTIAAKGIYTVRTTDANGHISTSKVVVK